MKIIIAVTAAVAVLIAAITYCFLTRRDHSVQSISGTKMVTAEGVKKLPNGKTVEQNNVSMRINEDNKQGSIKHVYVISAYSGQVIIYSTAQGKVTSSGKRLTPDRVVADRTFKFDANGVEYYTDQILGEDGTYGPSAEYLYWWDTKGVYHQHYISGGQIVHVSSQPLAVKGIIINMEIAQKPEEQ